MKRQNVLGIRTWPEVAFVVTGLDQQPCWVIMLEVCNL